MSNNSQVNIGPKPLGAVQESDSDSVEEYLGYLTFSTTGEAVVPREWLVEQWENYDLPRYLLPDQHSNWQAYRRMKNRLLEDPQYSHYRVWSDEYEQHFQCKFNLEKSDEMESNNVYILYAQTFYPEDVIGEEGGDWKQQRLGYFDFERPEDGGPGRFMTYFKELQEDQGNVHYDPTKRLLKQARELYKKMQTHHNYQDLQKIIDQFRSDANAVPIRRAVYFIGSHHQSTVEGLSNLWRDLNQFKEKGEEMRIETTPVVNLESQREMIADRARTMVEGIVDDIIGETMQKFEEDEEMTSDATAREIMNQLSETYDISAEYNALLSMRLSIKEILEEQRQELQEGQAEIVDSVIEQSNLEDYEE
jgi:hypothetical protein